MSGAPAEPFTPPSRYFFKSAKRTTPYKKPPRKAIAEGVRLDQSGSLYVRVHAGGRSHLRTFPAGTSLKTAEAWRQQTRATCHAHRPTPQHLRPVPPSLEGFCYIFFVRQGTAIKIGRATNVQARLAKLQTAAPSQLTLLVAVAAHFSVEVELHKRLEPYRLNGEWFIYGPEIERVVGELLRGTNPVEVLFLWEHIMSPSG